MNFDTFKNTVIRLAKRNKVGHMVPNSDTLYRLYEQKLTPEQVVTLHCTKEAQKERFNAN